MEDGHYWPIEELSKLSRRDGVEYHILYHKRVYTAQEFAAAQHFSGKELAKVVMVKTDGELVMMVLPASSMVDMNKLKTVFRGKKVNLARAEEFQGVFPDCETGAIPPFGNLYELEVYVDTALAEQPNIVFQAGSHVETLRIAYRDFANLVQPKVVDFATHQ